jgi:hypothetical protein
MKNKKLVKTGLVLIGSALLLKYNLVGLVCIGLLVIIWSQIKD